MSAHDHSDTRLSCIECAEPICPQCMVQCPVGNRCKKCAEVPEEKKDQEKTTFLTYVKVIACSIAVGLALSLLYFATTALSLFQLIVVGFCAMAGGQFIYKLANYTAGKKIAPYVGAALIIGILIDIRWLILIPLGLMHGEFTVLLMPVVCLISFLVPILRDS